MKIDPQYIKMCEGISEDLLGAECTQSQTYPSYFPPPWNINEHPEKTEGWIEFQKHMKADPKYYLQEIEMEWIEMEWLDKDDFDKDSISYFMQKMIQHEFDEISKGNDNKEYSFNMIKKEENKDE